jgi:hypothetical protein
MCIQNQSRCQQQLNSPATVHLCDAGGWNSQAYHQHKIQQEIRKGMAVKLSMTTYKLHQDKTHVSDGICKKSDDITLPSTSEN